LNGLMIAMMSFMLPPYMVCSSNRRKNRANPLMTG